MAIEMKHEEIAHSPNAIGGAATGLGYSRMAFVANLVANHIRGLGYQAAPSGNDTALSIPLAIAAGLGELGRMGMLVTEKFGPRVRICKVFTDMPLAPDTYRPFGVTEFCRTCKKCAKHCPSKAISSGDPTVSGESISNHSGVLKWYINPGKCYKFWVKIWLDCTNCINVCPFNKPAGFLHDTTRKVIRNTVDHPTTKINEGDIQRIDERRGGFHRAGLGEFGERLQKEYKRFVPKHPLSGALVTMAGALGHMVDAPTVSSNESDTPWGVSSWAPMKPIAEHRAPLTDDPETMARHIKETAYFLRADMVGICELPPYAVYTHGKHDGKPVELNHKYAIGILIDQDWRTASAFNGHDWISNSMSFLSYSTSGFIACILA